MGNKKCIPGRASGPSSQWAPGYALQGLGAVSSTNTVTSETFNKADLDNIGLQIAFTGTMTGTLTVNCSIDNSNFVPLTFTPTLTQPTGSALSYLVSLNQLPYPYFQVAYTNVSGSGTLTCFVSAQDLN